MSIVPWESKCEDHVHYSGRWIFVWRPDEQRRKVRIGERGRGIRVSLCFNYISYFGNAFLLLFLGYFFSVGSDKRRSSIDGRGRRCEWWRWENIDEVKRWSQKLNVLLYSRKICRQLLKFQWKMNRQRKGRETEWEWREWKVRRLRWIEEAVR